MKNLILKILAVITYTTLVGCSTAIPVKIDVSTANDLPKDVAIRYLNEIVGEYKARVPKYSNHACVFEEDKVFNHFAQSQYAQTYLSLTSRSDRNQFEVDVEFKGTLESCYLTQIKRGKSKTPTDEQMKMFTKIATALKSLGVVVHSN